MGESILMNFDLSYRAALQAEQTLSADLERNIPLRVSIGGNCNAGFLIPGLRLEGQRLGFQIISSETPYDGWISSALSQTKQADIWILWFSAQGFSAGGTCRGEVDKAGIRSGIEAIIQNGGRVIAIMPEALEVAGPFSAYENWRQQLVSNLQAVLPNSVVRIDPDIVHREIGNARWYASRYWTLAKSPCHPDAATGLGVLIANVMARMLKPQVKAIAVDLDDTLWGGVVGEAGVSGIALDPQTEGAPFLRMQRFLKDLSERGIPLCVVSKNNPEDALAPFVDRSEMILRRDDFVYFHANWESKATALKTIARDLNIGIDALSFLDDSVHERTEAKSLLPDLVVPELPDDPDARVPYLISTGLFLQPTITQEDLARVRYYKTQAERADKGEQMVDAVRYLRSLEMVLQPIKIDSNNLERVTNLVHKTNQFNLTNRRHSNQDIVAIAKRSDSFAYCYRLKDRFGDAGIISVLLGVPQDGGLFLDTWLMSCRVINRTVEDAIYEHLISWCKMRNIAFVTGLYSPSQKNVLVADHFPRLGFSACGQSTEGHLYRIENLKALLHCIKIAPNEGGDRDNAETN